MGTKAALAHWMKTIGLLIIILNQMPVPSGVAAGTKQNEIVYWLGEND